MRIFQCADTEQSPDVSRCAPLASLLRTYLMPSVHSHTLDLCVTKLYLTKLLILQRGFMNDSFAVAAGAWLLRSQNLLICLCAVVS